MADAVVTSLILVDTSVWIEFFRNGKSTVAYHLDELLSLNKVVMVSPIRAEILSGARNLGEFHRLKDFFLVLTHLPEPENLWAQIEEIRFRLIRKGHTVSLIDLMIALTASYYEVSLWSQDRDFEAIQREISLHLYHPPL